MCLCMNILHCKMSSCCIIYYIFLCLFISMSLAFRVYIRIQSINTQWVKLILIVLNHWLSNYSITCPSTSCSLCSCSKYHKPYKTPSVGRHSRVWALSISVFLSVWHRLPLSLLVQTRLARWPWITGCVSVHGAVGVCSHAHLSARVCVQSQ